MFISHATTYSSCDTRYFVRHMKTVSGKTVLLQTEVPYDVPRSAFTLPLHPSTPHPSLPQTSRDSIAHTTSVVNGTGSDSVRLANSNTTSWATSHSCQVILRNFNFLTCCITMHITILSLKVDPAHHRIQRKKAIKVTG